MQVDGFFVLELGARQPVNGLADQDGAGPGRLLQPLGDVDGVAEDAGVGGVAGIQVAADDRAEVDADAQLHVPTQALLRFAAEREHGLLHVQRGEQGADGIVFVGFGDAKGGQEAVADVAVQPPAQPAHRLGQPLQRVPDGVEHFLWVGPRRRVGVIAQVGKEHGDQPARAATGALAVRPDGRRLSFRGGLRRGDVKRGSAEPAEAKLEGRFSAARWTDLGHRLLRGRYYTRNSPDAPACRDIRTHTARRGLPAREGQQPAALAAAECSCRDDRRGGVKRTAKLF